MHARGDRNTGARRRAQRAADACFVLWAALAMAVDGRAAEALFVTTPGDGELAVLVAEPSRTLPAPAQETVPLPADARPHGASVPRSDEVLVADFDAPRLFRVDLATRSLLATLALPGRSFADGSLAVSPDGSFAISAGPRASGGGGEFVVVRAPFEAGAQATSLFVPGRVQGYNTQALAFAPDGTLYVCHATGISVLDPPYDAVRATVSYIANNGQNCVLSPDGTRLYATRPGLLQINVYTPPLASTSRPAAIPFAAGMAGEFGPMAMSLDGTQLLLGQTFRASGDPGADARLWRVSALAGAPVFEEIVLPEAVRGEQCIDQAGGGARCPGFEDGTVNADGTLAVFTGNSVAAAGGVGRAPAVFIEYPFDSARRAVHAVDLGPDAARGRGAGVARFVPVATLLRDGFESLP